MEIKNNLIKGVHQQTTPNMGGNITPRFIVLHYTAGWSAEGSISWLTNPQSKASAHLVVGRDGETTQLVPFDKKAWHAGPSAYEGYTNLNNYSIGIEIDNAGWMDEVSQGEYISSSGTKVNPKRLFGVDLMKGTHENLSSRRDKDWMVYSDKQLEVLEEIVDALLVQYPSIEYIVGHDEIDTRGWKTDPGPAFPMDHYKKKITPRRRAKDVQYTVDVHTLNVRGGPGTEYEKLSSGPVSQGQVLKMLEQSGRWVYVEFNQYNKGWVHGRYLKRVGS